MLRQQPLHFEVRDRLPRGVGVERPPEGIVTVAADRSVDATAARSRTPTNKREVVPPEPGVAHDLLQQAVALLGSPYNEQAGGVAVEPMDDARPLRVSAGDASVEQCVNERPALVPGRRMNDQARPLVDDEEMLVLVRNPPPER